MIESTALAERVEALSTSSPFYLWEVPQKPLAVHLSLELVGRLEREVVEAFRSVTARGSEIGGLLLGRVASGGARPVVSVEECELIECDYSRGPLYRLSDKDRERLKAAMERRAAEGKFQAVGFFRSHTRKGLALDADDLALAKEYFRDPLNVVLLVRPYATKASTGGFFIWEDGQIRAEASHLEFPFNRASLPARDPAANNAKPPARAQVVPIASRREAPAPAAAQPAAPGPPPPVAVKLEPPAPPKPAAPEPQAKPEPPAPPVVEANKQAEAVKEPEKQAEPEPPARPEMRVPFGKAEEAAAEVPAPGRKLLWICGAAAAVLLVILGLVFVPGLLPWRSQAPAPPSAESSGLALRAERSGGQWLLTWNRESEAIKTATKATLSINDGEQRENVDLDLAQLRNGSIVYSPLTGDVSFRLDVTGPDPSKSLSEYVRALGTRPSAMPAEPAAKSADNAKAEKPAAESEGETAEAEEEPVPVRAPARPLQLPAGTLAGRLRPARAEDLPEPPPTLAVVGGAQMPGNFGSTVRAPLPPPPPAAAPVKPASNAKIGGQVQQARLLSRKDPVYPPMARQARVRGVVRVEATVGKDGRVRAVKVVSGHPLLQQAAADAVKQWVYSPTLLNGQPVEFTTHVEVGFNLAGSN